MIVEQIWTGNAYRNFNYLIACPETGEALAIDPLDHAKCLQAAKDEGWQITQILNTHEHHDHTGGNEAMVRGHRRQAARAPQRRRQDPRHVDRGLKAGDVIKVGKTVELECLDTPGHTMCHICLRSHTEQPALFSGDTLFNAGAGNCHNGGDPDTLFKTFVRTAGEAAATTRRSTRATTTSRTTCSSRSTASPTTPPAQAAARATDGPGSGARLCHDAGHGKAGQHLLSAEQPERDRAAARGVPGSARPARRAHRVREAARAAQRLVNSLSTPEEVRP